MATILGPFHEIKRTLKEANGQAGCLKEFLNIIRWLIHHRAVLLFVLINQNCSQALLILSEFLSCMS